MTDVQDDSLQKVLAMCFISLLTTSILLVYLWKNRYKRKILKEIVPLEWHDSSHFLMQMNNSLSSFEEAARRERYFSLPVKLKTALNDEEDLGIFKKLKKVLSLNNSETVAKQYQDYYSEDSQPEVLHEVNRRSTGLWKRISRNIAQYKRRVGEPKADSLSKIYANEKQDWPLSTGTSLFEDVGSKILKESSSYLYQDPAVYKPNEATEQDSNEIYY